MNESSSGHAAPALAARPPARSIQARLSFLLVFASLPLLVLAGVIAWQGYLAVIGHGEVLAVRAREAEAGRNDAVLRGSEQLLQALSAVAELAGSDKALCSARLQWVWSLQGGRYENIIVYDAGGQPRCAARPGLPAASPGLGALLRQSSSRNGIALGPLETSRETGGKLIPAAYPIAHGGTNARLIYATLRLDGLRGRRTAAPSDRHLVWLGDGTGNFAAVGEAPDAALPARDMRALLLAGPTLITAPSLTGALYTYASAGLADGYAVLVALPAAADAARARHVLALRLVESLLLLGAGLAAMALGAHRAVVAPIDQLSAAVRRWQAGESFQPAQFTSSPRELAALAEAFAGATGALRKQEARLREAEVRQEALVQEIHHRVKNNLQIIASLLNLQAARIREPEARREFAAARDRVRALAILHRHLYADGAPQTIRMRPFLVELCSQAFLAMGETEGRRIALVVEAADILLAGDQAMPLALIVTEAVGNSLKFAFPSGRAGEVRLELRRCEGGLVLCIGDDGVGIGETPEGGDSLAADGLGMQLMRGFARQLGGTLTLARDNGTHWRIEFPAHQVESATPVS